MIYFLRNGMPACRESNRLRADNSIINLHARRREPQLAFAFADTMPARSSRTYLALLVVCAKVLALFPRIHLQAHTAITCSTQPGPIEVTESKSGRWRSKHQHHALTVSCAVLPTCILLVLAWMPVSWPRLQQLLTLACRQARHHTICQRSLLSGRSTSLTTCSERASIPKTGTFMC